MVYRQRLYDTYVSGNKQFLRDLLPNPKKQDDCNIINLHYAISFWLNKIESGEWTIHWITIIVVGQNTAIQVHSSLQISGTRNIYLIVQSVEPFVQAILVLILGYFLS